MTATVDEATLQRVRAQLEPLVDEYLASHPEIAEQFGDAFAAAAPVPTVEPAVPDRQQADVEEDDDDLSAAFAALFDDSAFFDEGEEDEIADNVASSVIDDIFVDVSDEDLGLSELFAEEDEDEEAADETGDPLTSAEIDDMLADDLDESEIERLLEAGAVMEYEDE